MTRQDSVQRAILRTRSVWAVATAFALVAVQPSSPALAQTIEEARALLGDQEYEAAAGAFAAITEREPENGLAWYLLGYSHHASERYEAAIAAYEKAEALTFNPPGTPYNIACAYARLGDADQAIAHLEQAAAAGFADLVTFDADTDLASLRDHPCFDAIRAQIERSAHPCDGEPFGRFDFWVGEWSVTNNGQFVGTNTIEKISNGCALFESWVDGNGVPGHSISYYDPHTERWKQTWVGGSGGILEFLEVADSDDGDAALRFVATSHRSGRESLVRMSFWQNPDGSVRQLFESSTNGGETWTPTFDGHYTREDQVRAGS